MSWESEFEGKVMCVLKAIQFASLLGAWESRGLNKCFWVVRVYRGRSGLKESCFQSLLC